MNFERAVDDLLKREGLYADRAADRGGKTMYGITERVARANGYEGAMRDMTIDQAKAIYRSQYWDLLKLDQVAALSFPIAVELFDTGVNLGTGFAAKVLQRTLNAFNRQGRDYPDLEVDGGVGPVTVDTLKAYLYRRSRDGGEEVMLRTLNTLQGTRYFELAEADQTQEENLFGWMKQRVSFA
jgi:lysozyme family protein